MGNQIHTPTSHTLYQPEWMDMITGVHASALKASYPNLHEEGIGLMNEFNILEDVVTHSNETHLRSMEY